MSDTTSTLSNADKLKVYEWFYKQLESLTKSANLALNAKDGSITHLGTIKIESPIDTNN